MILYHGTSKDNKQSIACANHIRICQDMADCIDHVLRQLSGSYTQIPYSTIRVVDRSMPGLLGDGVYAFSNYTNAAHFAQKKFKDAGVVVCLRIAAGVQIANLDNLQVVLKWATIFSQKADWNERFAKKFFDEETKHAYGVLLDSMVAFLADCVVDSKTLHDNPYLFAICCWLMEIFNVEPLDIVKRTFEASPPYYCIIKESVITRIS